MSDEEPATFAFVAGAGDARERLDKVIAAAFARERPKDVVTRGMIQRWIEDGRVLVDGAAAGASKKVAPGQRIEVAPKHAPLTTAEPDASVTFPVLFEDAHLLVLDKPAGLVVHPARGHATGTLVNGLLARGGFDAGAHDGTFGAHLRPGIVHRLDKDTTGVMVVAKDEATREGLKALFATHDIERSYLALTAGATEPGTIATTHGRHPTDRMRYSSRVEAGKRAVTHVEVVERFARGAATLVRCTLETGRTHQIRVHLAEQRGTPVLGDPLYGGSLREPWLRAIAETLGRQALHAEVLGFVHPRTGERLRFRTEPPADMRAAIEAARAR